MYCFDYALVIINKIQTKTIMDMKGSFPEGFASSLTPLVNSLHYAMEYQTFYLVCKPINKPINKNIQHMLIHVFIIGFLNKCRWHAPFYAVMYCRIIAKEDQTAESRVHYLSAITPSSSLRMLCLSLVCFFSKLSTCMYS